MFLFLPHYSHLPSILMLPYYSNSHHRMPQNQLHSLSLTHSLTIPYSLFISSSLFLSFSLSFLFHVLSPPLQYPFFFLSLHSLSYSISITVYLLFSFSLLKICQNLLFFCSHLIAKIENNKNDLHLS